MCKQYLRQALRSPLPPLVDGFRHWWRHGARIRRAHILCQCADGLRLRRVAGWQERSARLYGRSVKVLGELAGDGGEGRDEVAKAAHRGIRHATGPYRALATAIITDACLLTVLTLVTVVIAVTVSSTFRLRLFPSDLAAGRPWTASDGELGQAASGVGPSSQGPLFFHTTNKRDPSVEIDLGSEHLIRGVRVENRTDCCQERALPLNVEVLDGDIWRLVFQRRTAFSVWKDDIGPVRGRKIRFLRPGTGYFHLKKISVYGQ